MTVSIVEFNECHFWTSLFLLFFFYFHQLSVPSPSFPLLCPLLIHSFEFLPSFLLSFLLNCLIIGHLIKPKLNRIKAVFPTLLSCYYFPGTLASNGHWPGKYCMATNKWFSGTSAPNDSSGCERPASVTLAELFVPCALCTLSIRPMMLLEL